MVHKLLIKTKRLRIYPASQEETEAIIATEANADLKKAYTEMPEGCLRHGDQWQWYAMRMIEMRDGTHIGDLCFKGIGANGMVEIGYGISEGHQGQGYATEAVDATVLWALEQTGVKRVEAETEPDNRASQRVLEKCGFLPSGAIGEEGPRFSGRFPFRRDQGTRPARRLGDQEEARMKAVSLDFRRD